MPRVTPKQPESRKSRAPIHSNGIAIPDFLSEESFNSKLQLEQRRTERSGRPFVLMLLKSALLKDGNKQGAREKIQSALTSSTRETDTRGWFKQSSVIGVIFTEIGAPETGVTANALSTKILGLLGKALTDEQVRGIHLSFHVFPEDWSEGSLSDSDHSGVFTDLPTGKPKKSSLIVKRFLDIAGSLLALIGASPLFLAIAIAIKLTSKGSVLFCQERVGRYGQKFTFFKFRSMYSENDPTVHQAYVKRLIKGEKDCEQGADKKNGVYKLMDDPRVTPVGKFLRKTSLDELPQFMNVLMGQMALVGPRPPVPYEVGLYHVWHRRRLLEVKPGITGLWQVTGRSRTKFDDMVRLDLQYAKSWSLWLDLKILWRTPGAVFMGDGAY